jgi:voltage-gated potassium channel Kch
MHLSQTSEFGLVILLIGAADPYRHVDAEVVSLVVMMLLITAIVSTYLVQHGHRVTTALVRGAARAGLEDAHARSSRGPASAHAPILLVGCFRVALSMVPELRRREVPFKVIDFNPRVIQELKAMGVPCVYGDISHLDTLEHAGAGEAQVLVSSIPDDFLRGTSNRKLLETFRRLNPRASAIVTAESEEEALALYEAGADHVLVPRRLSADHLVEMLDHALTGRLDETRSRDIARLTRTHPDSQEVL